MALKMVLILKFSFSFPRKAVCNTMWYITIKILWIILFHSFIFFIIKQIIKNFNINWLGLTDDGGYYQFFRLVTAEQNLGLWLRRKLSNIRYFNKNIFRCKVPAAYFTKFYSRLRPQISLMLAAVDIFVVR